LEIFQNRKLVIATKHKKEKVIQPILENALSVDCFVPSNFDTDRWGTFSGEVKRNEDVLNTLRKKCLNAMKENNCDLAIASEGSFGAHPTIFFAHADDEVVMLMDLKNDLEIVAREVGTETNFNGSYIDNSTDLLAFAAKANFPTHGLILKSSEKNFDKAIKGLQNEELLLEGFHSLSREYGKVYVETDMRALYNPTRMKIIEKATIKLAKAALSTCPYCNTPGFAVTEAIDGLPCEWCNSPTRSTLIFRSTCKKCSFASEEKYPHQKTTEDPMYCDFCNP
jgi:hypothetical protein